MTDTTLTLGTSTTLDYFGVDSDSISTMATTVSTSLTTAHPVNHYHYYYRYADSYINSLSDTELANITNLLDDIEVNQFEHPKNKQLSIPKQS